MKKTARRILYVIGFLLFILFLGYLFRDEIIRIGLRPTQSNLPSGIQASSRDVETLAERLETPWSIAVLPDNSILVTERAGTVQKIDDDGMSYQIDGVVETSEGGLLGIVLHPEFESNNFVYLYSTYQQNDSTLNKIDRYHFVDNTFTFDRQIIAGIPGANTHDGGALAFGPDQKLYASTGDANTPEAAQNTSSLAGKILRLNDDGSIPADNPFANAVFSYGHRNPQGITWDDQGRMWSTEHGPSGSASGRDELNLIERGQNYGWPIVTGDETREGLRTPIAQSGDDETWAPGNIVFANGSLFFTGLRGQTLYEAAIADDNSVSLTRHFTAQYGRLRALTIQNNTLLVSTSNTDGRGSPNQNDDLILRVPLSLFTD